MLLPSWWHKVSSTRLSSLSRQGQSFFRIRTTEVRCKNLKLKLTRYKKTKHFFSIKNYKSYNFSIISLMWTHSQLIRFNLKKCMWAVSTTVYSLLQTYPQLEQKCWSYHQSQSHTELGPWQLGWILCTKDIIANFSKLKKIFFAKYSPCLALITDPVHHAAQLRLHSLLPHVSIVIIVILLTIFLKITIMTNAPGLGSRHFEWQPH